MLFRILPVMVWAFTGSLVGTAVATLSSVDIKWLPYLLILIISALVQGYPTHILNEIYDWKSGADSRELGSHKSGGSKVLQARLLSIGDLWVAFVISNVVLSGFALLWIRMIDLRSFLYFFVPAYLSAILYSLPPFRLAYRPFLGEWLGGFSGIFFLILASYYAQTRNVNLFVILTACAVGLIYIGIMMFFHYLDFERDMKAIPKKNTTVVHLGLAGSRRYVYVCLLASCLLSTFIMVKFSWQIFPLLLMSLIIFYCHSKVDLLNPLSIVHWGKTITYAVLAAGLSLAAATNPKLLVMIIPIIVSFWAHKKFGKIHKMRLQVQS